MIQVWYRNFLFFKKTFFVTLFWTVIEPLIYLGAFGFGFGRYVPPIEGLPFIDFYYPGLLCSTAMMVAYFEATYPNYTKLTHHKTYFSMLLTPLTDSMIVSGEILWAATKAMFGVVGVVVISAVFGLFKIEILYALPILFLTSLAFACFGMIMISVAKSYDSFIYSTSGIIVPLSMLSGVYFSLNDVPSGFKYLAYLFPLAHATKSVRGIIQTGFQQEYLLNCLAIIAYAVVLYFFAKKLFKKKLIQ